MTEKTLPENVTTGEETNETPGGLLKKTVLMLQKIGGKIGKCLNIPGKDLEDLENMNTINRNFSLYGR